MIGKFGWIKYNPTIGFVFPKNYILMFVLTSMILKTLESDSIASLSVMISVICRFASPSPPSSEILLISEMDSKANTSSSPRSSSANSKEQKDTKFNLLCSPFCTPFNVHDTLILLVWHSWYHYTAFPYVFTLALFSGIFDPLLFILLINFLFKHCVVDNVPRLALITILKHPTVVMFS